MNKSLYILGLFLLFIPIATALNLTGSAEILSDNSIGGLTSDFNFTIYLNQPSIINYIQYDGANGLRTITINDSNSIATGTGGGSGGNVGYTLSSYSGKGYLNKGFATIRVNGSINTYQSTLRNYTGTLFNFTNQQVMGGSSTGAIAVTNLTEFYIQFNNLNSYQNITRNFIFANVTGHVVMPNFINSTIKLYNTTGLYLSYSNTSQNFTYNFTNLPSDYYTLNGTAYNSTSFENTFNRIINIKRGLLNITAINYTGGVVTSFNATITDLNTSNIYNYGTSTGSILTNLTIGNSYSILMYSSQLANSTYNITMQNFTQSLQYSAFPFNSINITAYLESTLALTNINASLLFTGSSYSYSYSLNGNSQIYSFFGDDTYSIQVIASGYATRTYVISVSNGSAQSLNIYMLPTNLSSSIGIYTRTLEDDIISGATIYIQHLINSSYTGLTQGITDGTGYIVFQLEEGKNYRMIISADNFNIFTRDIVPYASNSPYTFKLSPSSTFTYVTLTDYAKYWYSPTDSNLNGTNQTFTFTTYSVNGSIIYTYINCDGSIQNVSGSPTGSSVSVNLNYSATDIIQCMFAMDITGYGYYSFNVSYYSFDEVATSIKNSANYIRNNTDNLWLTLLSYVITLLIVVGIKQSYPDTRITGVILCVGMIFFTSLGWINAVAGGVSATIGLLLLYVGSRS